MKLDTFKAKPGGSVDITYIFRDATGAIISSQSDVTVNMFKRNGTPVEAGLTATGGPKYTCTYSPPLGKELDNYLVEFVGTYAGEEIKGYVELQVGFFTDDDWASLTDMNPSLVMYDSTSVQYASADSRLKALQAVAPPAVGRITKKRKRQFNACDDVRDYDRWKGMRLDEL